ncbi:hypothetical protein [Lysobacter arvi]|uniref:WD40 repeat domain-containing protein n=1 Tax=Lysobacter arvi TaxID=3038776 RepID=A0ABU1C8Z3_9GAMM|nr:hypothetical protein [Lysobacter arvi]MDR0181653.1 hypothetical protein [Lysobacter arvi]
MLSLIRTRRRRAEVESAARYLGPIRRQIRTTPLTAAPSPWRVSGVFSVPRLDAVGFDRDSELLLVVSHDGLGVIDAGTGEKIARKSGTRMDAKPSHLLRARGIGPLEQVDVAIAGRKGGGLPRATDDGWQLELVTLEWPTQEVLLVPPGSALFVCHEDEEASFARIESHPEIHACGFSYSGKSLVIAAGDDLTVYHRT